jgi:cyclopropane-fatty-acyl-phospholipid synthase
MLALLDARDHLPARFRLGPWMRFAANLFLRSPLLVNQKAITDHYTLGNDFYTQFIDRAYRFYSHCIFESDDETLEEAAEHKLESMFRGLDLRPGMRLLDIGAGWGGVFEYSSPRGVDVTSLTLVQDSYDYVTDLLRRKQLRGQVLVQDFLAHRPAEPYDAVVIYGVIEHIPYYRQFFERVWECLKPGGKIYIDASATKEKYDMSTFTRRYTWHGTHTFMCVQDVIQEALYAGFQIVEVKEESHDYELTMLNWAKRLDENREKIVSGWSEELYRAFRVFLWGGCHAFKTDRLQAYHVVARRGLDPGPRPARAKRFWSFLREIP